MKSLRVTLTLLLFLLASAAGAADKPMAVWFYADWCMNCKMLAPKLAQVQPEFEQRIDFIKLDVTNEERKAASREQAKKLGVYPLYMANKATGWIALIDTQGKQVGEIRHFMSIEEMRSLLAKLAAPGTPTASP